MIKILIPSRTKDLYTDTVDSLRLLEGCGWWTPGDPTLGHHSQDWALLSLRFELHLLAHAFLHDCGDPERLHCGHRALADGWKPWRVGSSPKVSHEFTWQVWDLSGSYPFLLQQVGDPRPISSFRLLLVMFAFNSKLRGSFFWFSVKPCETATKNGMMAAKVLQEGLAAQELWSRDSGGVSRSRQWHGGHLPAQSAGPSSMLVDLGSRNGVSWVPLYLQYIAVQLKYIILSTHPNLDMLFPAWYCSYKVGVDRTMKSKLSSKLENPTWPLNLAQNTLSHSQSPSIIQSFDSQVLESTLAPEQEGNVWLSVGFQSEVSSGSHWTVTWITWTFKNWPRDPGYFCQTHRRSSSRALATTWCRPTHIGWHWLVESLESWVFFLGGWWFKRTDRSFVVSGSNLLERSQPHFQHCHYEILHNLRRDISWLPPVSLAWQHQG